MQPTERETKQREIIEAIKRKEHDKCGSFVFEADGKEWLGAYHSGGTAESCEDFFVFEESFASSGKQQTWQEDLMEAPYVGYLGHANVTRFNATRVVSFHHPLTKGILRVLHERFTPNDDSPLLKAALYD